MIQLHRLEGFYWVSVHNGYAQAARNFPYPITQPAVHQQVSKLEKELGLRLFERVAKDRVVHTAAGRRLFEFCEPFFADMPAVLRAIRAGSYGGELRIDGGSLTIRQLLPSWIRTLAKARPDIHVILHEGDVSFDRLRSGATDLIVDMLPAVPAGFESKEVARASTFLVMPESYSAAKRARATPVHCATETFISYPPGSVHCELQMAGLKHFGVAPERMLSASSADSIVAFVAAGLGYSLVPSLHSEGLVQDGVVFKRQSGAGAEFSIAAAWRKSHSPNPHLGAALRALAKTKNRR